MFSATLEAGGGHGYAHCVGTRALTLEELRAMVGALDPDVLAAEGDVDRTLITLALERSLAIGSMEPFPRFVVGESGLGNNPHCNVA